MNINQARDKYGELLIIIYWHGRGTSIKENIKEIEQEKAEIEKKLNNKEYSPETNSRGNIVDRGFLMDIDRYQFDFKWCSLKKGWIQYDTKLTLV